VLEIKDIQVELGYIFKQESLLYEALTHRSFSQTHEDTNAKHNERLEFLGDAVLGLVISESLVAIFPTFTEGELSKLKAGLISRATLARAAGLLQLGQWLRLGRGEEVSSGREKHSLLANALEALIGAVYLDGGLEAARAFISRVLAAEFSDLRDSPELSGGGDWKSRLQEWVHKHEGTSPQYRLVQESGPDHQKVFAITVEIRGNVLGRGEGRTKKEAEQHAAEQALVQVSQRNSDTIGHSLE
jgi:ribonuclease III